MAHRPTGTLTFLFTEIEGSDVADFENAYNTGHSMTEEQAVALALQSSA